MAASRVYQLITCCDCEFGHAHDLAAFRSTGCSPRQKNTKGWVQIERGGGGGRGSRSNTSTAYLKHGETIFTTQKFGIVLIEYIYLLSMNRTWIGRNRPITMNPL